MAEPQTNPQASEDAFGDAVEVDDEVGMISSFCLAGKSGLSTNVCTTRAANTSWKNLSLLEQG
jgi:hypothetical protein